MKKSLFLLFAATFILCSCAHQSLDEIRAEQTALNARLSALEEWQKTANVQIESMQSLIAALADNDYVTGVSELPDGSGYMIAFLKNETVIIKNGRQGEKGNDGAPGIVPNIGVKENGGVYYWTLDGSYILDNDGSPLRVTGERGETGMKGDDAVAPKVRINAVSKEWEISIDKGASWTSTGVKAIGKDGVDGTDGINGASSSITVDDSGNSVIITITNTDAAGMVTCTELIELPFYRAFYIGDDQAGQANSALIITAFTTEIPFTFPAGFRESDCTAIMVQVVSDKGVGTDIRTRAVATPWSATITKPVASQGVYTSVITVHAPAGIDIGDKAMLEVTIVGTDGRITCVARALISNITATVGDYYYSDGTFSTTLDNTKTPIGVIFHTGNVAENDSKLKGKISDTSKTIIMGDEVNSIKKSAHGLVVALKDASAGISWQSVYRQTGIGVSETSHICGYSNTQAMKAWNDDASNSGSLLKAYMEIAAYTSDNPTPQSSSGWYFPSVRELSTLCSGWVESGWSENGNYGGINVSGSNVNVVNEKLEALSDFEAQKVGEALYWSSSEVPDNGDNAFFVNMYLGYVSNGVKGNMLDRVRAVLAF